MTNETEITTRPDLTSEARKLIDRARAEGDTQLLQELLNSNSKALLPSPQEVTNTQVPSNLIK